MYIDSGADLTFVPNDFGKLLEMNLRLNPGYVAGITGRPLKVSLQDADIKIGKQVIRSKIAIASRNNVPYLLGRESIFRLFKISFEEYEELVRFVPKKHIPPRPRRPTALEIREHKEGILLKPAGPVKGGEVAGEESYKKILQELGSMRKKWR